MRISSKEASKPNARRSTKTMPITVEETFIRDLYCDPVMAVAAVFGENRLDAFQRAMLRFMWFCPVSMDTSGQGSGKTWLMFIYLNLRAVLLPDQHVIYLPQTLDQGKRVFWNKYYDGYYLKQGVSPIFTSQLRRVRGSQLGTLNQEGFSMRLFRNGSQVMMIPPNIQGEGKSAAGEDCNTIGIEEFGRLYDSEKGKMAADGQFASRWRRAPKREGFPFGNQIHWSGHAEEPSHPSHMRFDQIKDEIAAGSTEDVQYTFCYRDFSPEVAKLVVNTKAWNAERKAAPELFKRKYLGLRESGLDVFYPQPFFNRAQRTELAPECKRGPGDCEYFAGQDFATAATQRADFSSHVVIRLRYLDNAMLAQMANDGISTAGVVQVGKYLLDLTFVFAARFKRLTPSECAGMLHWLNALFGYTSITGDPGGGGNSVYSEMNKPDALIHGVRQKVVPICAQRDASPDRLAIWRFFELATPMPHIDDRWKLNLAGLTAETHNQFRKRLAAGQYGIVAQPDHHLRSRESVAVWTPEQIEAAGGLRIMQSELLNVGQRRKGGVALVSALGSYPLFGARGGKKDIAMAGLYATNGVEKRLHELSNETAQEDDEEVA